MKIDRLYTLSQFVELLDKQEDEHFITLEDLQSEKFEQIVKYNDFLKQPLKKEMFVNDLKEPKTRDSKYDNLDNEFGAIFNKDFKEWQEAEKKVILDINKIDYLDLNHGLCLVTLNNLAEFYDGELELKNVEL